MILPSMIPTNKQFRLAGHKENKHPKSSGMNYLTWKESAAMLLNKICKEEIIKDFKKTEPLACAS